MAFSGSGSGTSASPYIITTASQLQEMANDLSAYYELGNDINATSVAFTPIGTSTTPFSGTLDGAGFTITSLTINLSTTQYVGLIGYLTGTITRVKLTGASITGSSNVGALVGFNDGTVSKCSSAGSVSGSGAVGGLIGSAFSSTTENAYSTASVTLAAGGEQAGGLIGYVSNAFATITDCYSAGKVSGGTSSTKLGGLVGDAVANASATSCYWDTQASGQSTSALGTGETTAAMEQQATYSGWDFANTWTINTGVSYPTLQPVPISTNLIVLPSATLQAYLSGPTVLPSVKLQAYLAVTVLTSAKLQAWLPGPTVLPSATLQAYLAGPTVLTAASLQASLPGPTVLASATLNDTPFYLPTRIDRSRVRVSPDGGTTWYDLTKRVLDITVAKQKDGGTATADVTFANAPADGDNLSPLVTPLAHPPYFLGMTQVAPGGQQLPAKLIDIGNIITVDGAYTTDGSQPTDADLYPLAYAVLGAQTKTGHDDNGNRTVAVHALDYASGRLNTFYLNDTTGISPGAPEAVIQNILDKALGAGVMTLYTPVASGGSVTTNGIAKLIQNTTAWQAIQSIAEQVAFDCRWLWQPSLSAWRLTFYQPSRSMTNPDFTVDTTGMYVHHLDTTDSYLRNQCTVEYRDSATGQRATITYQDTTGPYNVTSKVGVRAVYITESDTSIIDTSAEANTMAQTVVNDLSNRYAQVEIDLPFEPTVEIYKILQATDAYISDSAQTYAVDSVEHHLSYNTWKTTVKLAGEVSLRKDAWLQKHGAPGAKRPFRLGDYRDGSVHADHFSPDGPATPTGLALATAVLNNGKDTVSSITATWTANTEYDLDHYDIRYRTGSASWSYMRTADTSLLIAPLPGNLSYAISMRAADKLGNASAWTADASITTAKDATAPATPTGLAATGAIRGLTVTLNLNPEIDFDHFEIHASATSGFTPSSATLKAQGRNTRFDLIDLVPSTTYYVAAIAVDTSGNTSAATAEVSGVAGVVQPSDLNNFTGDGKTGIVGNRVRTTDGTNERVSMGDVSGLLWGGGSLPTGSYGIWGKSASLWLNGYPKFVAAGGNVITLSNVSVPANSDGSAVDYTDTTFKTSGNANYIADYLVYSGRQLICMAFVPTINFPSGLVMAQTITQWQATQRKLNTFYYNVMIASDASGDTFGDFELLIHVTLRNVTSAAIDTVPTPTSFPYFWLIIDVEQP